MYFKNKFDNLDEDEINLLNTYFDGYDYDSSAHTFLANYIWRNTHNISWEIIGKYLVIESYGTLETEEEEHFMSFPLTNTGEYDIKDLKFTIDEARKIFNSHDDELEFGLIPKGLVHYLTDIYGDEIETQHDREDDEYIYDRMSLETLSGRKFHQKKNHLNYFHENFEFIYEEITKDNIEEVRHFIHSKNEYKLGETPEEFKEILELETEAIDELLDQIGKREILSGIIRNDGEIEAATMGEYQKTNDRSTVIVHVEKADDRIRGLYQAINNEFIKHLPPEVKFINREEDMGLNNLRQAKEGYRPIRMSEKYSAWFK